jgi:hypothetical protein
VPLTSTMTVSPPSIISSFLTCRPLRVPAACVALCLIGSIFSPVTSSISVSLDTGLGVWIISAGFLLLSSGNVSCTLIPPALRAFFFASSTFSTHPARLSPSWVFLGIWGRLAVLPPSFSADFLLELEDEQEEELEDELEVDLLLTLELALAVVSQPLLSVGAAFSFLSALVLLFPELVVLLELLGPSRSSSSFVLCLFPASRLRPCRLRLSCRGGVCSLTRRCAVFLSCSVSLPSASSLSDITEMSALFSWDNIDISEVSALFSWDTFLWLLDRSLPRPRSSDFSSLSESPPSPFWVLPLPFALGFSSWSLR